MNRIIMRMVMVVEIVIIIHISVSEVNDDD